MPATRSEDQAAVLESDSDHGGYGSLPLARKQVQSNVLRSMNPLAALYIFFHIVDVDSFRILVHNLVDPENPHNPGDDSRIKLFLSAKPEVRRIWSEAEAHDFKEDRRIPRAFSWTLAFTWTGLQALGIDEKTLASFPEDFREGMAARAARLGDVGASSPEHWEEWFGNRQTHGVLSILLQPVAFEPLDIKLSGAAAQKDDGAVDPMTDPDKVEIVQHLRAAFEAYGFASLHVEFGTRITHPGGMDGDYRIEHFGFRDGVSQPFADARLGGPPRPPPPGGGTARPGGTWDPVALGELLLGRPDEDGIRQHYPANKLLRDDGTYMVFRKLEQDVIGFRRYLVRHDTSAGRESRLAAQMVGRWPNGTSLVRAPDFPADELSKRVVNDFRYRDEDPGGRSCPIGAHARRLNPRDANNRDEARRHRIWRRSITYGGPFLPYGASDDGGKRGMLFIALCARIDQQFEFLQTRWLNGGEFVGHAGIARCPLTGANGGDVQDSFVAPGRPAPYTHLPRFVTTKGGDYFFMPSIPALEKIAAGGTFPSTAKPEDDNPAIDETPKVIDPEALFEFGRKCLLPDIAAAKPGWIARNGIVLVGRHAMVRRVLGDDTAFQAREQDKRIRRISGGEGLMLGLPTDGSNLQHDQRLSMWRAAAENYRGPPADAIAAQAMQAVLARQGPAGRLDVVRDVSVAIPMVVARHYFGVKGPESVSASYTASLFNKLEISQVPREWLAVLPHVPPQDVPTATLAAWTQIAFAQVFVNIVNARELAALAERTTGEFLRHLDKLITDAVPHNSTLLGCLLSLHPGQFRLDDERFRVLVRLLLIELTVASGGTLAEALPNVVNYLLEEPGTLEDTLKKLKEASTPTQRNDILDAVIREALRFDPVSPILFRQCTEATELVPGQPKIPAGSTVAALMKTAMFDPAAFPDPDSFLTDPARRPAANYLHFGDGPHHCKGADIATLVLREMARAIIGLKDLRRAAGPLGNVFDSLGRYQSLVVRFTP